MCEQFSAFWDEVFNLSRVICAILQLHLLRHATSRPVCDLQMKYRAIARTQTSVRRTPQVERGATTAASAGKLLVRQVVPDVDEYGSPPLAAFVFVCHVNDTKHR
jgi:hypothetical protein